MNIDFYIPGGGGCLMYFLYANIDIEHLDAHCSHLSKLCCETAGGRAGLVDKYPPIAGQFVVLSKKCSCFITRIMKREQQTSLLISFSSCKTNKEKQSNVFLELGKYFKVDDEELRILRG